MTADHSTDLVLPHSGELISLEDVSVVARAIDEVRQAENQLRDVKRRLTEALIDYSARMGTRSFPVEGVGTATVTGGPGVEYDAQGVEEALRRAGMPEERIRTIVEETVTYKVNGREAQKASRANPAYAAAIEAHTVTVERPAYVSFRRGGG